LRDNKDLTRDVEDKQKMEQFIRQSGFDTACNVIKATLINEFEQTKFKDSDARDEIWRKVQALEFIKKEIETVIITGQMSEKTLLERAKQKVGF